MKKHLLFLASIMLLTAPSSWAAFHFSHVAPSGQTLYFNITDSSALTVEVTCPGENATDAYVGYINPTGVLVIPSTVTYNDTTYTVTALGSYALYECDSITRIELPATVTTLDTSALLYCYGLSGMEIPSTVTTINYNALGFIRNITYHGTATGDDWGSLGLNAYYETPFTFSDSTKTILLGYDVYAPSTDIPATVTTICGNAFFGCKELDNVLIPSTVTEYGSYIFYNSNIKKLTLPEGLTSIPRGICAACDELVEVHIPSTTTSIGSSAFMNCRSITSIVIPSSVTNIENYAFSICMCLTDIISLNPVAPAVGSRTFYAVPSTVVVNIPCGSTPSYDSVWGNSFTEFVEVSPVVTVFSDNDSLGYAEVIVEPSCANPLATVQATAGEGYVFSHWSDGSTENPYSFDVTGDTTLTAYFATVEGIDDIDNTMWSATVNGSTITINGICNSHVRIFDALGRILYSETPNAGTVTIQTPNAGVYMIQVGNCPARRIVTIN